MKSTYDIPFNHALAQGIELEEQRFFYGESYSHTVIPFIWWMWLRNLLVHKPHILCRSILGIDKSIKLEQGVVFTTKAESFTLQVRYLKSSTHISNSVTSWKAFFVQNSSNALQVCLFPNLVIGPMPVVAWIQKTATLPLLFHHRAPVFRCFHITWPENNIKTSFRNRWVWVNLISTHHFEGLVRRAVQPRSVNWKQASTKLS